MRVSTTLALLAVMAVPAGAQATLGLGGGTGIGSRGGRVSSAHEVLFVELHLPVLPGLRIEAINANTRGSGTLSLDVSGVFELPTPVVRPYALAGWGTYGLDDKGAASGWNVGAGLRTAFVLGPSIFVEFRRHDRIARDLLTFGIRL